MSSILNDIRLIAFDADDTLWPCQSHYNAFIDRYASLLRPWISEDVARSSLYATETRRIPLTGYGVKAFTLSLIENAITATHGTIDSATIQQILHLGYDLMEMPITLADDVRPTLEQLRHRGYQLLLLTKGELLDQQRKINRSDLAPLFDDIHIVTHKDTQTYQRLTERYHLRAEEALMIGDSLKSDIIPALEAHWHAAWLPSDEPWQHEYAQDIPTHCHIIHQLADIL